MFIPQDVDEVNGGTLIVPGSHRLFIEAGSAGKIERIRRPINLKAKAGTIMIFDGRVLHGTGVNRTDQRRYVATMSNVKSWMRQQENWVVSTLPEIIDSASPKLLHRMGMQSVTWGATVEGFGLAARGRAGDRLGNIQKFRQAQERHDLSDSDVQPSCIGCVTHPCRHCERYHDVKRFHDSLKSNEWS